MVRARIQIITLLGIVADDDQRAPMDSPSRTLTAQIRGLFGSECAATTSIDELGGRSGHQAAVRCADQYLAETTMFPLRSRTKTVSPSLFQTAEPWLHQ